MPPSLLKTERALFPLVGAVVLFYGFGGDWSAEPELAPVQSALIFSALLGTMIWGAFAVVRHAETLAALLGEPLGTLILTLSVILIEVAMIVAVMVTSPENSEVARDTMFAVLMIVLNAMVGLCLLAGGIRHNQPAVNLQGTGAFLAALILLGSVSLILPSLTPSTPGGEASLSFSVFLIAASIVTYGMFLFVQTGTYRGWFRGEDDDGDHHVPEVTRSVPMHGFLLMLHIVPIVLLAKKLAVFVDAGIHFADLPTGLGGLVIAVVVLSPEALVAVRAAQANLMQRSINVCLGSGLATIGLTVPAVLAASFITGSKVELGLHPSDSLLLGVTFLLTMETFNTGRTNYLQGILHLVLFGAYFVLIFD